jgi:anti-anti-sigma factor
MAALSIIELPSRIDTATLAEIERQIGVVLDRLPSGLVLDFTQIVFVSSQGLRVLLTAAKRCRQQNTRMALHSVPTQIVELMKMSGLLQFFPMFESREAALATFAAA